MNLFSVVFSAAAIAAASGQESSVRAGLPEKHAEKPPLTDISEIAKIIVDERLPVGDEFVVTGKVLRRNKHSGNNVFIKGENGCTLLHPKPGSGTFDGVVPGCLIRVRGITRKDHRGRNSTQCDSVEILSRGKVEPPVPVTAEDIHSGRFDFNFVKMQGVVRDAFRDDIDKRFFFLSVSSGGASIFVPVNDPGATDGEIEAFIGAYVTVNGIVDPQRPISRRQCGRVIGLDTLSDVQIVRRGDTCPFDAQEINDGPPPTPTGLWPCDRRKIRGLVIAAWRKDMVLVKMPDGELCRVQMMKTPAPVCGDCIEAVGFPETDMFRINLMRAIWRRTDPLPITPPEPTPVKISSIVFADAEGKTYENEFYGKAVRLRGIVRSVPDSMRGDDITYIDSDGQTVKIDASSVPEAYAGIEIGSRVEVTAICVFDINNWRGDAIFPRIYDVRLVLRFPGDLTVIAPPPWWTPLRLLAVIGLLLAVIAAILIWAVVQRRLARLRLADRTRLSIELHDSISQYLASIALQTDAVRQVAADDRRRADEMLALASRTIDSCRVELRNCIRDLRDETLEAGDMNEAVKRILAPHLGGTKLYVRFRISRRQMSRAVAYAVLRIIRELVSNAVIHGRATAVRVAGAVREGKPVFSVADNGCGFDVENRPDASAGHFGLSGVEQRVKAHCGRFEIRSVPGKGTKAVITMNGALP